MTSGMVRDTIIRHVELAISNVRADGSFPGESWLGIEQQLDRLIIAVRAESESALTAALASRDEARQERDALIEASPSVYQAIHAVMEHYSDAIGDAACCGGDGSMGGDEAFAAKLRAIASASRRDLLASVREMVGRLIVFSTEAEYQALRLVVQGLDALAESSPDQET